METKDLRATINEYLKEREPDRRFASFDYCYNYFYKNRGNLSKDTEKTCMVLWSYLASWGMLRGSCLLLQKSPVYLKPLVNYLDKLNKHYWEIDVDCYDEPTIKDLLHLYGEIKKRVIEKKDQQHLTLVTKIMLGVFGNVPAYDSYFCKTFKSPEKCGFTRFNEKSLEMIRDFYQQNKHTIDHLSNKSFTYDFLSEKESGCRYSKAKIIDMYGFQKAYKARQESKGQE